MKGRGLRFNFAATTALVYVISGALTFLVFHLVTERLVRSLGISFAVKQALLEKSKLMATLEHDLALSVAMSTSPTLRDWAADEDNDALRGAAARELEGYRSNFKGGSLFFIIDRSRHYFFINGTDARSADKPRYTLEPGSPGDGWYFRVMRDVDSFELNVDYDEHLQGAKAWINTVLRDAGNNKVGLCGTGIDITDFIDEITGSDEKGLETMLVDGDGAITAYREKKYVLHNSMVRGTGKKITVYDILDKDSDRAVLREAVHSLSSEGKRKVETFYLTLAGKRYLAAMSELEAIHWFNLVLLDPSHVAGNRDFLPILAVTVISLLCVVLTIGFLLDRRVLRHLSALASASNRIAQGDFESLIPVRSADEMGALAASFNDMARMVKDHSENLENKVNERTEELRSSNAMLAESNRSILESIRYARMIQVSLLPEEETIRRRTADFFAIYRPRDIVGGDFYFFREAGENFVISVIDCTGHGVPGAFMTMTANAVLGHVLDAVGREDPALILGELNRRMQEVLHQEPGDGLIDNGLDIGLCWCSPGERKVVFAGARMELYHVSGGALASVSGDRQPIGYRASDPGFSYTNHAIIFEPGTCFYLATDGILDQSGGPKGLGLGRKRFNECLAALSGLSAEERKAAIENELARYQGGYPQRDDITVIGFRL
jgi:serine phosphatase RsbU (regulator of sigma subunit)